MNNLTVQQLLQQHLADYRHDHTLDNHRLKVCRALLHCHTPALGGCQYQCDHCQAQIPQYHSCRNRHCPQCQQRASRRWCERQQQAILPVTYYHLVFTLPHTLNGWVQLHPEVIYPRLFQVVWQTLQAFAADPRRLNGKLGMTAVLHTWGQNLSQHVHLHCLIPGGVLTEDQQWKAAHSTYLFPVRALSRHFRGRMVSALRVCATTGEFNRITRADDINNKLNQVMQQDWVVYSKPCLNHSRSIVGYLARYTHRIAISDQRLIGLDNNQVQFCYQDYRDHQPKVMTLRCDEFIRRFLMHVLPKGLMRIRHYGLLANRCRKAALQTVRKILVQPKHEQTQQTDTVEKTDVTVVYPCPKCQQGQLVPIGLLKPVWPYDPMVPG